MENKKGIIKVRSAVMMKAEYVVERHPDGRFTPSQEMIEKLNEQTPEFREPIITFINDLVENDWGVVFTPFTEEKFDVRIYCDTKEDFEVICNVIKDKLKHKKFQDFFIAGTANEIETQW